MPTLTFAPTQTGNPNFLTIPNSPGVYMLGVKLNVGKRTDVFCPLYVGKATSIGLRKRICQHYALTGTSFNSLNELFDLTQPIQDVYSDIEIWNLLPKRKWLPVYQAIQKGKNTLIWHNAKNGAFYNNYFGPKGVCAYMQHKGHAAMYSPQGGEFAKMLSAAANKTAVWDLISRFIATKQIILSNFCFSYATCVPQTGVVNNRGYLGPEETAVKIELQKRCIWTYSMGGKVSPPNIQVDLNKLIDLY